MPEHMEECIDALDVVHLAKVRDFGDRSLLLGDWGRRMRHRAVSALLEHRDDLRHLARVQPNPIALFASVDTYGLQEEVLPTPQGAKVVRADASRERFSRIGDLGPLQTLDVDEVLVGEAVDVVHRVPVQPDTGALWTNPDRNLSEHDIFHWHAAQHAGRSIHGPIVTDTRHGVRSMTAVMDVTVPTGSN